MAKSKKRSTTDYVGESPEIPEVPVFTPKKAEFKIDVPVTSEPMPTDKTPVLTFSGYYKVLKTRHEHSSAALVQKLMRGFKGTEAEWDAELGKFLAAKPVIGGHKKTTPIKTGKISNFT